MKDNQRQAVQLAYLAGLMDGEGSFMITRSRNPYNGTSKYAYIAGIQVGMVTPQPLHVLKSIFGGSIYVERVPGNRQDVYRWRVNGRADTMRVIEALLPYLMVKREAALVLYDFCKNWEIPANKQKGVSPWEIQRREEAYQKIRQLNAVGAAATTKREGTREGEAIV